MALFIIGLVLFFGPHLFGVFAPAARERLVASVGRGPYRGLYSLVSGIGLVLLVWGFGIARQETSVLYDPPIFLRHIALLLMLVAMIVLVAGFLPPGHIAKRARHPQILAVKIWAFAHLLANGETVQVILFAAFLAWGVILRISYKRRARAGLADEPVYRSWHYDIAAVAIGAVLYLLIVWRLHLLLIGVPVM